LLVLDTTLHRRLWRAQGNPGAVLARGEVVGTWRARKRGQHLTMTVEPFAVLSPAERRDIEAEAQTVAPLRGCAVVEVTVTR
jgi:hypothetical protein